MIEPPRRAARLLFALTLTLYLFTAGGSLTSTDAVVTFDVTRSIVEHGSVAMSGNLLGREEERGVDGRYYSPFGVGQSIYNIPFYLAARGLDAAGIRLGKPDSLAKACVALGETLLVALVVRESFLLFVAVVGSVPASLLSALTLGLASILWPYSKFGFNQPLACLTLVMAMRQLIVGARTNDRRRLLLSGLLLAASLMTRHEMALAALPFSLWLMGTGLNLWKTPVFHRLRPVPLLLAFTPGVIAGVLCWGGFNYIRFGNPLISGQDPVTGFGSPIVAGLQGLLFSPGASVFLYSPVALAGAFGMVFLWKRDRSVAMLCCSLIAILLLFYSTLGNWIGGRSYGSRYMLVLLPYFGVGWAAWLAALRPAKRRLAVLIVGGLGCVVQLPGVLVDYAKVSQAAGVDRPAFTIPERQWRWEASSLSLNTRALARALPENIDFVLGRRPAPPVAPPATEGDSSFSQQFRFSLDLWWLYLHYMHVLPSSALVAIVAVFLGALAFFALRLY